MTSLLALALPASASAAGCGVLGLLNCPPASVPGTPAPPPDATPHPGTRLIPLRADGRLPFGFNDLSTFGKVPLATYAENGVLHRGAGSTIKRVPLDWGLIEPLPGQQHWASADKMYIHTLANGQRPLLMVSYAPAWAVANPRHCANPPGTSCRTPPALQHHGGFANFAAKAAARYPLAIGIEVWNEPNLLIFWRSYGSTEIKPNAAAYTRLVRYVYNEVKEANPTMPVIAGSLNNTATTRNGDIAERQFVDGMYASGIKGSMDALSVHPYPVFSDSRNQFQRSLDDLRVNINKWNDAGRRIWLTELGAPINGQDGSNIFGEDAQRDVLIAAYRAASAAPDVDVTLFHPLVQTNDRNWGQGWIKPRDADGWFHPRKVYCAFAAELSVPGTCGPMRSP